MHKNHYQRRTNAFLNGQKCIWEVRVLGIHFLQVNSNEDNFCVVWKWQKQKYCLSQKTRVKPPHFGKSFQKCFSSFKEWQHVQLRWRIIDELYRVTVRTTWNLIKDDIRNEREVKYPPSRTFLECRKMWDFYYCTLWVFHFYRTLSCFSYLRNSLVLISQLSCQSYFRL